MKKILFLLTLAAVAGIFYWWYLLPGQTNTTYRTVKVERGDIRHSVDANGTLNPLRVVNVGTQVSGTVKSLYVDFNDNVEKDKLLAELDPSLFETQLSQSKANLATAESSLRLAKLNRSRTKSLLKQEYVSQADLDKANQDVIAAEAQLSVAKAQVVRDQVNLDYTVIRSPVAGVVISREVDVGQTVAASFQTPTLYKIAQDLKEMQIDTNVSEADVGVVKVGQHVTFTVDSFPDKQFAGLVKQVRLNSTQQQNVVSYDVVVSVENPDRKLIPGMTAFVTIIITEKTGVLRVPNSAFRFKPSDEQKEKLGMSIGAKKRVYILTANNKVTPVLVSTGTNDSRFTEVAEGSGLKEGDLVIVEESSDEKPNASGSKPVGRVRLF